MSRPYWWFQGESVATLTKQLLATPGARLEVYLDGQNMTFVVVPQDAIPLGGGGPINESHVCPPDCP